MKSFFIDTSVIINFLRNKESAVQAITNTEGQLTSSFVCLAELYEGIYRVREKEEAERAVLDFFTGLNQIYGIDNEVAKKFGQIRSNLKAKGNIIEDLDILIAVTCVVNNLTLITANPKHFSRIDNLEVLAVL